MSKQTSIILTVAVGLAGLLFLLLCITAYQSVGGSGFDNVLAEPWGLVTLADVMLGGICMGAVILGLWVDVACLDWIVLGAAGAAGVAAARLLDALADSFADALHPANWPRARPATRIVGGRVVRVAGEV